MEDSSTDRVRIMFMLLDVGIVLSDAVFGMVFCLDSNVDLRRECAWMSEIHHDLKSISFTFSLTVDS